MIAQLTATVENGLLKLDAALPFPDQTRVKLTVQSLGSEGDTQARWQALLAKFDERPILGTESRYTREELYDRD